MKRVVFVSNAAYAIPVLDLISRVYLAYHATQISEVLHSPVVFDLSSVLGMAALRFSLA